MKRLIYIAFILVINGIYTNNIQAQTDNGSPINNAPKAIQATTASSTNTPFSMPEVVPVSPEAASIAKYINYPVDCYSGLAKIEIPIYEINSGDISLPLVLRYHSSGTKTKELDGSIALGWSLSAEPMITREIKGLEDEKNYIFSTQPGTIDDILYNRIDIEQDIFYYQLLQKSGKFLFKREGNRTSIFKFPYEPIDITYDISRGSSNSMNILRGFQITDENGFLYTFDVPEITYSPSRVSKTTTWKASSIKSPNRNDEIKFLYSQEVEKHVNTTDYVVFEDGDGDASLIKGYSGLSFPLVTTSTVSGTTNSPVSKFYNFNVYDGTLTQRYTAESLPTLASANTSRYDINCAKLFEIQFKGGKAVFRLHNNTNSEGDLYLKLKDISIFDNNNQLVKRIKFFQSKYRIQTFSSIINYRYKLDSVQITDKNDEVVQTYKFEYNPSSIPDYKISKSYDHWGYYNGENQDPNQSAVPFMTFEYTNNWGRTVLYQLGEANRNPNHYYAQAGILKKIIYPTGGYTMLEYEPHNSCNTSGEIQIEKGGVRIASIEDYDNISRKSVFRFFKYEDPGDCFNNVPYWEPLNLDYRIEKKHIYHYMLNNYYPAQKQVDVHIYSSQAYTDNMFHNTGSSVVYRQVHEYVSPSLDINRSEGKTVYTYNVAPFRSYDPDTHQPYSRIGMTPYFQNQSEWQYGQLRRKEVFNSNGELVLSEENTYETFNMYGSENYAATRIPWFHTTGGSEEESRGHLDVLYVTYNAGTKKIISQSKNHYYPSGDSLREFTSYTYDPTLLLPVSTTTTDSKGEAVMEEYKYTSHMNSLSGEALQAKNLMMDRRQLSTVWEKKTTTYHGESAILTQYGIFGSSAFPKSVKYSKNGSQYYDRLNYNNYDAYGNIKEVSFSGSPSVCYIWGYNSMYPIAKVENATWSQIIQIIPEYTLNTIAAKAVPTINDYSTINTLRFRLPNALVTTYKYKPLVGVTEITNPHYLTTYYEYDDSGRLKETYYKENDNKVILQSYR
ncbi:MAG: hypothetical protein LIO93_12350, partial [Bacteroidales bacterium]|nr:hypothetical protein [Bacteroidales bacterium]